MEVDNYLSVGTVARRLGLSRARIHVFRRDGRIRSEFIAGRWLTRESEIERFKSIDRITGRPKKL